MPVEINGDSIRVTGVLTRNTVSSVYANSPGFQSGSYTVDLCDVSQVDSSALALLVYWKQYASKNASNLQFKNVPDKLKKIAELSGVEKLF